jgi:TrmH family RNA methyltransferase
MKKCREAERLFLAEGEELVRESPTEPSRLFTDEGSVRRLSTLTTPSGPVAVFPFVDVSEEEVLRRSGCVVLLHGLQDPGNVGTIIRSAHAFGAGVALSEGTADLYNPKTVRATMGSIFHVSLCREVETGEFLKEAREAGFLTVAAVSRGGEAPESFAGRVVLVIGAEGSGLPDEVVEVCERRVSIPASSESLNAAISASILLYAVC